MKEIPLKINRHKKIKNWELAFNFIHFKSEEAQKIENWGFAFIFICSIPLKNYQTDIKVHQQIEIAFDLLKGDL